MEEGDAGVVDTPLLSRIATSPLPVRRPIAVEEGDAGVVDTPLAVAACTQAIHQVCHLLYSMSSNRSPSASLGLGRRSSSLDADLGFRGAARRGPAWMRSSRAWSLAKAPSTQPLDAGTPGGDQCDPEIGALLAEVG